MNIKSERVSGFKPITLTIEIESESELRGILATFNTSNSKRLSSSPDGIEVNSSDINAVEMPLWDSVAPYYNELRRANGKI